MVEITPGEARTVAVDFDGVIHAYSRGWHDGSIYDDAIPGALDGVRALMAHFSVFIHTSRTAGHVAEWLIEHGIQAVTHSQAEAAGEPVQFWTERGLVLVSNRKLPAIVYLDDRAVRFTSWAAALAVLLPEVADHG
ncbi:hypothetical protein [Nonomuraea typhae]|uniref:hypothetical protein n=1 Tax=Nonomuraea typhae TaxID=2603600 RepID=UPI0012FC6819|nr:hypothetical protein [Nonomuraea typhae]